MTTKRQSGIVLSKHSNAEEMSRGAANFLLSELRPKPDLLLCTATGASPTRIYQLLAEERERDAALFQRLRILKLDEWGGLAMDDPGSCESYLQQHVLGPLGVSNDRYIGFQSEPRDPEAECARIRSWLSKNGPIDVCVLGLGTNGHLAMNEPADVLQPIVHTAKLAQTTLGHSMLAQSERKPSFGLTLGLSDIFHSKQILLPVSGTAKSEQLARLMAGGISTQFPASLLWLHPAVTCFCDADAASKLGR